VRAASVETPVTAILQKHPRKAEDRLDKLPVAIGSVSKLGEVGGVAALTRLYQDLAAKRSSLGTLIQLVRPAEVLEDGIESVEQRGPVVKVTSWEWPCRRE
jgi:hypothetical protein